MTLDHRTLTDEELTAALIAADQDAKWAATLVVNRTTPWAEQEIGLALHRERRRN